MVLRVPGRTTLSGVGGADTAYDLCGHRQCVVVVLYDRDLSDRPLSAGVAMSESLQRVRRAPGTCRLELQLRAAC